MAVTEIDKIIGGRLKSFRELYKIKQKDIATGSGSSQSHISAMETGEKQIQPRVILYLAEQYDLNVDWLFTGRGDRSIKGQQPESGSKSDVELDHERRIRELEEQLALLKLPARGKD